MSMSVGKESGILAGCPFFEEIFKYLGCTVEWKITEGRSKLLRTKF
jgi:nicotinate-nucleotide pyrophosphorylase (carboxylating)